MHLLFLLDESEGSGHTLFLFPNLLMGFASFHHWLIRVGLFVSVCYNFVWPL